MTSSEREQEIDLWVELTTDSGGMQPHSNAPGSSPRALESTRLRWCVSVPCRAVPS
jgi:hypothetical protein